MTPEQEQAIAEARKKIAKEAAPVETTASDVARQVGKGLSFGWSPEIEAGARAPFSDQSYDQIANQIRARNKAYEAANPLESLGCN